MKYFELIRKIRLKLFGSQVVYSQNGEDIILLSIINKPNYKGFYIDIGANHPKKLNNTYLLNRLGWHGINIEPNPFNLQLFKKKRPKDINLNIGISSTESILPFYLFKEDTLSTFDKEIADKYELMGHKIKSVLNIDTKRLENVLDFYVQDKHIDFMSIDTEGYDLEILKTNNWNKYRPSFILLETLEYEKNKRGEKVNEEYDSFMKEIRYRKIAETYINTLYINEDYKLND